MSSTLGDRVCRARHVEYAVTRLRDLVARLEKPPTSSSWLPPSEPSREVHESHAVLVTTRLNMRAFTELSIEEIRRTLRPMPTREMSK